MSVVRLLLLCFFYSIVSAHYHAEIKNDGPVVLGASITFRADVYKDRVRQEAKFKFKWRDNMHPQNTFEEDRIGLSIWKINHSPENYSSGTYEVEVRVFTPSIIIDWPLCYGRAVFTLADNLVGELVLQQNNTKIENYISNALPLQHVVKLHGPDNEYLKSYATDYNIDWWIDGSINNTSRSLAGLNWKHQYLKADESHTITVAIVATRKGFSSSAEVNKIDSTNSSIDTNFDNATDLSIKEKSSYSAFSNITNNNCQNPKTQVCGNFTTKITVKAPVQAVNIAGNNWLKHGDMLNLRLTCNGSAPFHYCVRFFIGEYKVVGNETCKYFHERKPECDFSVAHYFSDSRLYTVLMIVSNDISKNISAVGVNIYEVTKHPQLSVIVVPLTASFLAIILIIFGIAFYFQNRNSYAIEVADFDFTNNNDLEYKTFKERLSEAIHNAFNKPEDFSEEDSYNGVPSTSNKKYGSMQ